MRGSSAFVTARNFERIFVIQESELLKTSTDMGTEQLSSWRTVSSASPAIRPPPGPSPYVLSYAPQNPTASVWYCTIRASFKLMLTHRFSRF